METIVSFGAAIICAVFYLISVACRMVFTTLQALLESIEWLIQWGTILLIIVFSAYLLSDLKNGDLFTNILAAVALGGIYTLLFRVGAIILSFVGEVAEIIADLIQDILDGISSFCERVCSYFLSTIQKRLSADTEG